MDCAKQIEIGVRAIGVVQIFLSFITWPFFKLISLFGQKKTVPKIENHLLLQSATTLARRIRERDVTSEDVVKAYIRRINAVNPILNAVVEERFIKAIEEAKEVDKILSSTTKNVDQIEKETPLLGVPVTVKESCKLKGSSYSVGSLTRQGERADTDGRFVGLVRKAGAIPLCVTNTPELCLNWETDNLITGRTNNPYDTRRTSGGSSGGEGALLGSGASVIGVGSDIAGSIRLPAMFNGIFGHKPSGGIISIEGHLPNSVDELFQEVLVMGPMTRYAEDLKLLMKIGTDNMPHLRLDEKVDLSKIKIHTMERGAESVLLIPVEQYIQKAVHRAAEHFKNKFGTSVEPAKFINMQYSCELSCGNFFSMTDVPNLLKDPENPKKEKNFVAEIIKSMLGVSQITFAGLGFQFLNKSNCFIPKSNIPYYNKMRIEVIQKFKEELGYNGVFFYPTFPTAAYYHRQAYMRISGVMYSMIFNVLGLPSTHVPMGLDENGLPYGIQVVAGPHQDRLCLAVAEELEKAFGGWIPPPETVN